MKVSKMYIPFKFITFAIKNIYNYFSISLRTMDFVFKNDAADFLIGQLTTVEKLGHSFHMHELW